MATFYENQQEARRKTGLLAFYFFLAVALIILAVDVVVFLTQRYLMVSGQVVGPEHVFSLRAFSGFMVWLVGPQGVTASLITLLVIALGSVMKTLKLGKGGDKVAILAGGSWVDLNTAHPRERQLLNVVEEMAIASGIKPPRVYLLREETGINAFVAGLTPNDSVLAITQGALDQLSRDELQGVIGHEFSHILNSDMRINVRMIGLLAGILMISQIGRFLMDSRSRSMGSSKKSSNAVPVVGAALWLIGSIGLFFGRLIKAALSRQREFLADASSVQFTRNPLGIGGALLKIREASQHSHLTSRHADDISHMCFGEVMAHRFNALFATHPPLDARLRAIDPQLEKHLRSVRAQSPAESNGGDLSAGVSRFAPPTGPTPVTPTLTGHMLKASVGQLSTPQIRLGERLHSQIPAMLHQAAHHGEEAALLLYALVLAAPQRDASVNQALKILFDTNTFGQVLRLRTQVLAMPLSLRLPLLDLLMPTLQHLPIDSRKRVVTTLHGVMSADKHVTFSECAYFLLAEKYLAPQAHSAHSINSIHKVENELVCYFNALARASQGDRTQQQQRFAHAMRCLGLEQTGANVDEAPSARTLMYAVHRLSRLSPLLKQSVIDNAVDMVIADRHIHLAEIELLRAFCELLDCPMPPVDASQLTL